MDVISELSRIRILLKENEDGNLIDKDVIMDLLTYLIPNNSIYRSTSHFYFDNYISLLYLKYSVNKELTIIEKYPDESYYEGIVFLDIVKMNILDLEGEISIEDVDWYEVPEYVFTDFENEIGTLCYKYGLSVSFDYVFGSNPL